MYCSCLANSVNSRIVAVSWVLKAVLFSNSTPPFSILLFSGLNKTTSRVISVSKILPRPNTCLPNAAYAVRLRFVGENWGMVSPLSLDLVAITDPSNATPTVSVIDSIWVVIACADIPTLLLFAIASPT